jgi:HEAT repeat protein
MSNLEQEIRERYLNRLHEKWDAEEPRLDFGSSALPYFIAAFNAESILEYRVFLLCVIWQFRDADALPTLAAALKDSCPEIWKEALDGFVTIGGDYARQILLTARQKLEEQPAEREKCEWIDEAIQQVSERLFKQ